MCRRDDLGRRVLGFIKGSPRTGALASAGDLAPKFDVRAAMYSQADPVVGSRTSAKVVFKDFDEFADAIHGIAGRFVPTARPEADWWVQVVPVGRVAIQQIQIGGASTFAGVGTDNALTIGIPLGKSKRIRIDGQPLDDDSFILVRKGQPFTFAARQTTRWAGITVPLDHPCLSDELLTSLSPRAPYARATHNRAHLDLVARTRTLVLRLCTRYGGVACLDAAAAHAAEEEVMVITSQLLEASSRAVPKRTGRPQFSRDRVIARALCFIEERRGEPLLIQDLCGATQVSERTLRTIFQEHFGVGPMRLLKVRELREIRCALLSSDASDHTVTKIAARFGVWDFSLFARNYKALFGETPLQTLRSGVAARACANAMNDTWRYAAAEFSAADRDALAALTSLDSQLDALILQQRKLMREIDGCAQDLHGFAAWVKEFSRSQCGETRGNA
jgi:AraC family transcriptional regulator, ethanolamine operon transcriptional activator